MTNIDAMRPGLPKHGKCPNCGGEGYESNGGSAYMHDINCDL